MRRPAQVGFQLLPTSYNAPKELMLAESPLMVLVPSLYFTFWTSVVSTTRDALMATARPQRLAWRESQILRAHEVAA